MKNRFIEIDIIKGISIIAVILIHTSYYFISNPVAAVLWKWSQFSVPAFVFCSAYLYFKKPKSISFRYLKSRIIRLVKPYYIFLLFFLPMLFIINPEKLNIKYVIQSIFIVGGVDINWLVLLFIYFMLIFPFILFFFKKYRLIFILYCLIATASSVLFLFYKFPFNYKYIFWIPWSAIPLFTMFFIKIEENRKWLNITTIASGIIFISSYYFQIINNLNTGFIENKYPPNFYFLSYGIFSISLFYLFSKRLSKSKLLTQVFSFFSIYAYPLYFIHYIILIALAPHLKILRLNWVTYFMVVLITSVIIQLGINHIITKISKALKA